MNHEIAWMYAPIAALLSQIGGTWWKPARRFVLPIGLALTLIWCGISILSSILCGTCVGVVAHLPITLIGDSVPSHWLNWIWLWVYGFLLGFPVAFIIYLH